MSQKGSSQKTYVAALAAEVPDNSPLADKRCRLDSRPSMDILVELQMSKPGLESEWLKSSPFIIPIHKRIDRQNIRCGAG